MTSDIADNPASRVEPAPRPNALTALSLASSNLHPDDLAAVVAGVTAAFGFDDFTIYLADLEQRTLTALRSPGMPPIASMAIDDSDAGRAYRSEQPILPADSGDGAGLVWLPLLDSSERIGVVSARLDMVSDEILEQAHAIANLAGELVANKESYGDVISRTRRTREMSLSAEMRWSMLPPLTFTGRNITISGILEPAYDIAGDTFDYAINGDVAHVALVDAVGHGLEAARIANLAVGSYRHSRRHDLDLVGTYRAMDAAIASQFGTEKFAAAQLVTVEMSSGTLRWLNAGIPAPIVIRDGAAFDLAAEVSLPIGLAGIDERAEPTVAEACLERGDLVLFSTDGVVEARSVGGEEFGTERFRALATAAAARGETAAETLRVITHAVLDHQKGVLQDDATLVLVAWNGPPDL